VHSPASAVDPSETAEQVRGLRGRLTEGIGSLSAMAGPGDWQPAPGGPRTARTATASDPTRGGAVTLHRAATGTGPRTDTRQAAGAGALPEDEARRTVLTDDDLAESRPASATRRRRD
jgi:hypothetical protein